MKNLLDFSHFLVEQENPAKKIDISPVGSLKKIVYDFSVKENIQQLYQKQSYAEAIRAIKKTDSFKKNWPNYDKMSQQYGNEGIKLFWQSLLKKPFSEPTEVIMGGSTLQRAVLVKAAPSSGPTPLSASLPTENEIDFAIALVTACLKCFYEPRIQKIADSVVYLHLISFGVRFGLACKARDWPRAGKFAFYFMILSLTIYIDRRDPTSYSATPAGAMQALWVKYLRPGIGLEEFISKMIQSSSNWTEENFWCQMLSWLVDKNNPVPKEIAKVAQFSSDSKQFFSSLMLDLSQKAQEIKKMYEIEPVRKILEKYNLPWSEINTTCLNLKKYGENLNNCK